MRFMHAVWRWWCVVSPPGWVVGLAFLFYLPFAGLSVFFFVADAQREFNQFGQLCAALVLVMTASYAIFRGVAFHPAMQHDYLAWLALTPWRDPKPLPMGPVQIVAQDFAWLAVLELLLLDRSLALRLCIPVVFFFVLATVWAGWIWILDSRTAAYEIGYALAAAIWCASWSWWVAAVALTATSLWALRRFRQSLAAFPWEAYRTQQLQRRQAKLLMQRVPGYTGRVNSWGWTYDLLSPQRTERWPVQDRLLLSILLGWTCLAVVSHAPIQEAIPVISMLAVMGTGGFAVWTVFRYVKGHAPPISVLGRLVTGRLLMRSYDVALLPVVYWLLCLAVGVFFASPIVACPGWCVLPLMLTLCLVLINVACPDLDKWRLTSASRLSAWPYANERREYEQL